MTDTASRTTHISRLALKGYKSIAESDLPLLRLNVLIGANGAGKSNYISFFRFIGQLLGHQLQTTVGVAGGADQVLSYGRKQTEALIADIYFGELSYSFELVPTADNRLMFQREVVANLGGQQVFSSGYFESEAYLYNSSGTANQLDNVFDSIKKWRVYHFHDTGPSARVKQVHSINDNEYLRDDARNLAAFLLRLQTHHPDHYQRITKAISLVAPFFGDFHLRPTVDNKDKIQLEWTERGEDEPFPASALSDGTLRFVCLATVLLQPEQFMPTTILIDEPELGLHPFAIKVLAGLMKSVSHSHQLIMSTQSVELVNEFTPEDLVVVDKRRGVSSLRRLGTEALSDWLAEYSLGELWKMNILGGRPGR